MWREIRELGKTKPIIASMADVAASGGYYMVRRLGEEGGRGKGNGKELWCSLPSADSSCVHHPHHLPSTSHPPAHVSAGPQAMGCSKIVAERSTITGSIGVVTGKFNLAGLYEKLGYNKEVLSRCGNQQRGSAAGKGWFARACSACCCRPFLRCP